MGRSGRVLSTPALGFLWLVAGTLALAALTTSTAQGVQLVPDFYKSRCPRAETLITSAVNTALNKQARSAVGVLRLFFHDCFVNGCDASVLIEGPGTERNTTENAGLHGFEIIDAAKTAVEQHCPGLVSCADILAIATQLSVKKLSGGTITYKVPLGRRDGLRSSASDVSSKLPKPSASVGTLKSLFLANGLATEDMVALSGAHSVGTAGCSDAQERLKTASNATLDASFGASLAKQCPAGQDNSDACHWTWQCADMGIGRVNLDVTTPTVLDEKFFKNLQAKKGLLASDQILQTDPETQPMVAANAAFATFKVNFARALIKMGNNVNLKGGEGEIRRICSRFN